MSASRGQSAHTLLESVTDRLVREREESMHNRSRLLPLLREVQEKYRYLPEDELRRISRALDMPSSEVYGVATFYKSFSLVPKGKNIVTVCSGTACHVRGSVRLVGELEKWLGVGAGENTPDGVFSFETVDCLGCCALGPVMVVNGQYYSNMKSSRAIALLKRMRMEK